MPDPLPAAVLRPLAHLRQVAQQYPGLWPQLDRLRAGRGKGLPQWPDWCSLPLAGTVAALTQGAPQPDLRPLGMQSGMVGALAAWRATPGISRVDSTVCAAVWDTPVAGDVPTARLSHLPAWCGDVPVAPARPLWQAALALHGCFVPREWDANTHHRALRCVLDTESREGPSLLPMALPVQGGWWVGGSAAADV